MTINHGRVFAWKLKFIEDDVQLPRKKHHRVSIFHRRPCSEEWIRQELFVQRSQDQRQTSVDKSYRMPSGNTKVGSLRIYLLGEKSNCSRRRAPSKRDAIAREYGKEVSTQWLIIIIFAASGIRLTRILVNRAFGWNISNICGWIKWNIHWCKTDWSILNRGMLIIGGMRKLSK